MQTSGHELPLNAGYGHCSHNHFEPPCVEPSALRVNFLGHPDFHLRLRMGHQASHRCCSPLVGLLPYRQQLTRDNLPDANESGNAMGSHVFELHERFNNASQFWTSFAGKVVKRNARCSRDARTWSATLFSLGKWSTSRCGCSPLHMLLQNPSHIRNVTYSRRRLQMAFNKESLA